MFLDACDDWQFPIFLTLMLTGMRPGELAHLFLPDDLDLDGAWLYVRNKPEVGWQVKTRSERKIPLVSELVSVLRQVVGHRRTGPVFLRRRFAAGANAVLDGLSLEGLKEELFRRIAVPDGVDRDGPRQLRESLCRKLWVDAGSIREDRIRSQFMMLTSRIGLQNATAPKVLRHMFATTLQDANVDPLIRNQLMGHTPSDRSRRFGGLLGMTAVYTHTQDDTLRRQLVQALASRSALAVARSRLTAGNARGEAA